MESCLKIAAFFKEDPAKIFEMASRPDLIDLHRKFIPEYRKVDISEEDLYERDDHVGLHQGLQRLLERGMETTADVAVGVDLLNRSFNALLESESQFRRLVETTRVIPWEADSSMHRFNYIGPQIEGLMGYPRDNWYEEGFWTERLHPEERASLVRRYRRLASKASEYECEYRMLSNTGKTLWFRDNVFVEPDGEEGPVLRGILLDVTRQKSLEQKLKESEERYRNLVEASPDAVVVHCDDKVVYANPSAIHLLGGKNEDDLSGRPVSDLVPPADWALVKERIQKVVDGGQTLSKVKETVVRLDGKHLGVEVSAGPVVLQGKKSVQTIIRPTGR